LNEYLNNSSNKEDNSSIDPEITPGSSVTPGGTILPGSGHDSEVGGSSNFDPIFNPPTPTDTQPYTPNGN